MESDSLDKALCHALAVDLCAHWKQAVGKSVLSVADLFELKAWVNSGENNVLKYASMNSLATKGLDELIAENYRINPPSANLLRA